MKNYSDNLLLEFLMFSDDIETEIEDFRESILQIDNDFIYKSIESIEEENIYTEKNIENLKKIIIFLKDKLGDYEGIMSTLCSVKPSNDIYYYEYLEKFEVLELATKTEYIGISKDFLEKSIRFDYYAFRALTSNADDYEEKFFSLLTDNPMFLLFVNKLLNEQPDIMLNKVIRSRINCVLTLNTISSKDEKEIEYEEQLLKKVNYFAKNKKVETFDYELFDFYRNKAFFESLITSNVSLKRYHDYITSDKFLGFLEEYINIFDNEEGKKLFNYDSEMSNRFKLIITYILRENENNEVKIRCNNLLSKWYSHKFEDGVFYEKESLDKLSLIECIRYPEDDKLLAKYMKLSLQCDYQIFETYSLDENGFNEVIEHISPEYFLRWMRKMLSVNADFFRNKFLRERTYKILQELTLIEEYKKEIHKMKRKIQKINKGLE